MIAHDVPLISRRRDFVLLFQKIQHALPSFVLLMNGVKRLEHGDAGLTLALALAEIVTSALVIGSIARSFRSMVRRQPRHHGRPHAHRIDWIDIFLAAMLAVEAVAHQHETGHLPRPTVLLSATMLLLGLLHGRIDAVGRRRRALRLSDDGVSVGGRFFRRFSVGWRDILRIDLSPAEARIVTRDGRERRINLKDLKNEQDVRGVLAAARARMRELDQ